MCLNCWVAQTVIPRVCDTLDALPEHQQHVCCATRLTTSPRALTSSCSLSFCHFLPQKLQVLTALDACQRGGKLFDTVQNTQSHSRAHCPFCNCSSPTPPTTFRHWPSYESHGFVMLCPRLCCTVLRFRCTTAATTVSHVSVTVPDLLLLLLCALPGDNDNLA